MDEGGHKNLENFGVVKGGLYGQRSPLASRERCKAKVRDKINAILRAQAERGARVQDRGLENVMAGVTEPSAEAVKLMWRLKLARRTYAQSFGAVIVPLAQELAAMYGGSFDSGEFPMPPSPAQQKRAA